MSHRLFVSGSMVYAANSAMLIPDALAVAGVIAYASVARLHGEYVSPEFWLMAFIVIAVIHGAVVAWAIHKSQHVIVENINRQDELKELPRGKPTPTGSQAPQPGVVLR